MSSHADCTHEKTKAARAACRAGKGVGASTGPKPAAAADRLREKASAAASKLGEPRDESGDVPVASAISGFCGNGSHDRCPGGGRQWHCDCDCHTAHTA